MLRQRRSDSSLAPFILNIARLIGCDRGRSAGRATLYHHRLTGLVEKKVRGDVKVSVFSAELKRRGCT